MALKRICLFLSALAMALLALAGCESLKTSKPIVPVREYEKLVVGRFDANYVGTRNCLKACHYHDRILKDFEASTMGAQMRETGLPVVDCETCHGPGSLAIAGLTREKVEEAEREGRRLSCDYETFIDIENLPAQARSLICLKCHTANATFNLHNWNSGVHALSDVSCSDCHRIHAGPDLIVRPREAYRMCFECHGEVRAEFALPSHHPVLERKVICTDCHDPHGTTSDKLLRRESVKATCTACHAEKEGPYVFEHADVTEDCTNCHNQHGSVNNFLLKERVPFLCLQCHDGHRTSGASPAEWNAAFYTRCTDCHSQIHGTDLPSPRGKGLFIN
ncbi:MAG: DmsE family decaheme c-type cytochrome [Thermodesulfovibrionales bacterium]